jgi:hypothetical protein
MNRLYHDICTSLVFTQWRMIISHRQAISKLRYAIAILQCIKFQKSSELICISAEAGNHSVYPFDIFLERVMMEQTADLDTVPFVYTETF